MMYHPKEVLIEKEAAESPLVKRILTGLIDTPVQWVDRLKGDNEDKNGKVLEIMNFRGRFVKSCPGTRFYNCCGYQILNLSIQCSLCCTYCILQAYFPHPHLRVFANLDDMLKELKEHLADSCERVHRIGTGEFTDSLLLDSLTHTSELLVPFFAGQPNAVLELKTKTAHVDLLEPLDHRGHTIVAWSLNPERVIVSEEPGSATLKKRLEAARRCQQWGYRIAFHFDPLIAYPEWKHGYQEVVEHLFSVIDPRYIAWISLGTLRFMPALKSIIRERYPTTTILDEEFVPGLDGKLRYFRDLRVEMYSQLRELLLGTDKDLCIYLCMESDDVWREVFGYIPAEKGGLSNILDRRAVQVLDS